MTNPMTTCPELGQVRAWLDPPAGGLPDSADRQLADHLAACPACRAEADDARRNRDLAGALIGRLGPDAFPSPAATELARKRLDWHRRVVAPGDGASIDTPPTSEPTSEPISEKELSMPFTTTLRRWRVALGGVAAALALTFMVGTPEGQTAAAQFLAQFRSQRFTPITVPASDERNGLAQLEHLGTVQGDRSSKPGEEVKTIDEASRRVGFQVKQPDAAALPTDLSRTPKVMVSPSHEVRFTFDRDKAREYYRSVGRPEVSLPEKFHGVSLAVSVPSAALLAYEGVDGLRLPSGARRDVQKTGAGKAPSLMIGQAGELKVGVDGNVPLEELREFLLGLPGLPAETVQQLRAIQDWRNTLPIPVPADRVNWQQTNIGGGQGLLLADNTGAGGAAIWQRDGRIYGVFGAAKADEIRRVADSLR